ncbi:MAG: peroxide stress protein YaaA [Flavobacteriaceae bacterium]|jgi:hypothetical protein|nr:peroxide stress protein YaaA [Flavobacteriaceae bacterium]
MKIIISPAKSLNFQKELPIKDFSIPLFLNDSCVINESLRLHSPKELKNLMGISEKLADLNWKRNINFKTPFNSENARPAIFTFAGDVYNGLDAFSLSLDKVIKAQDSLRILSGLYGLLRPLDLMQPYRLEMGTKLNVKDSSNLYEFWKEKITNKLNDELIEDELFINLASNEYSSVINKKKLVTNMVSPIFKDMKNGKLKIISFYAKKARGMMVRYILDNEINNEQDLKGFNHGGYSFSSEETEISNELVFIR